ncbi:peptide-methionine (S)-S-oxide reductase MsrA [Teredinibacter haidensis]|uniref:peptide-methionine (S)-S-oxide reductase MsrA n=1 Tax=Teredinibacter haidensis TaxID=2731755 RepID=UPI0009489A48|nr:peptide-methionine (S)-S-oxide reductase MsrA [Teredinibacter haidensis]
MSLNERFNQQMPKGADVLPGRSEPIPTLEKHAVLGVPLKPPFAAGTDSLILGLGCFWGAEKRFWALKGVRVTAVGYTGGITPNPTYEEVCSGCTGHNEAVLVVFDPKVICLGELLTCFWESHNPTQGMRQGNDTGTQYRSGIYANSKQQYTEAEVAKARYAQQLSQEGFGEITTEVCMAGDFFYAEAYHQQYLFKNPNGYCGLGGTGVAYIE